LKTALIVALAIVLLAAGSVSAATILVPTLYVGPGALGSRWYSNVVVNNHSAVPFSSPGVQFLVHCPIPEGCFSAEVAPGAYGHIVAPRPAEGLLLTAPDGIAEDLAFQARFGQEEQFRAVNGAELPLVREHEFVRRPIRLPAVALHTTLVPIRTTLRIYGIDAIEGTTVRVEVRSWFNPSEEPLASKVVTLRVPASPAGVATPIYPAYAQLAMQQEFPFEVLRGTSFNITIVPLPLGSGEVPRIWAFLSTTTNTNDHVSIQQPQ
jgi:hypothetical protein